MIDKEKKEFWEVLGTLNDCSRESLEKINNVYKMPKTLCRFRPVNESTLLQLQDNKLLYSSANYYDDPFDTYFYVDYKAINDIAKKFQYFISDNSCIEQLQKNFPLVDFDSIIKNVRNIKDEPEKITSEIKTEFLNIREEILKQTFSISFCEDPKNETLWLKYANNHKGFVLIYDMFSPNTYLCGKMEECKFCMMKEKRPNVYPVFYSNKKYDATRFALGVLLQMKISLTNNAQYMPIYEAIRDQLLWETERISLIKKKCHKYDKEWRMICPFNIMGNRPCCKMHPKQIALGLRMPKYEKMQVVSAAKLAGITDIKEMYINDKDSLDMRNISF